MQVTRIAAPAVRAPVACGPHGGALHAHAAAEQQGAGPAGEIDPEKFFDSGFAKPSSSAMRSAAVLAVAMTGPVSPACHGVLFVSSEQQLVLL